MTRTATIPPTCECTADVPCLDHVEAVTAAFLAQPSSVDEAEIRESIAFLDTIDDLTWEIVIGQQGREAFALLAQDRGEDIHDAWRDAVDHAAAL